MGDLIALTSFFGALGLITLASFGVVCLIYLARLGWERIKPPTYHKCTEECERITFPLEEVSK